MNRQTLFDQLTDSAFDLLIIGGGATGFAAAVDALSRGYSVALVERGDFGVGTSSRSTKLIHGGVRYLRQGQFSLVHEALHERSWFLRAAPDLVHPLPFIIPCRSRIEQLYYRAGMGLYDLLAGRHRMDRSRMLSAAAVADRVPGCAAGRVRGGVRYMDGQFDDARMLIRFLRHVLSGGGVALNHCPAVALIKENGRVRGAMVQDAETGREYRVAAKAVISAAGVFTDGISRLDEPGSPTRIAPSQGIHFVLDASYLGGASALMIPKTSDGRVLFAIPWHGRVLYGTTDTPVPEPERNPRPLDAEVEYLIDHARHIFSRGIDVSDIITMFAGLRPLPAAGSGTDTSKVSRKYALRVSASGLVTLYGGKWTSCRVMGEAAVDKAAETAGLARRPSRTRELVFAKTREPASHLEPPDDEWIRYTIEHEMARTADDVLMRRTRIGLLNPAKAEACRKKIEALLPHHQP